ncbi:Hypothetical protein ABZS17G119_01744 [Kosakonia cowanii]
MGCTQLTQQIIAYLFLRTRHQRLSGVMSQICNEPGIRALRRMVDEFIIKTYSDFYKTQAMR